MSKCGNAETHCCWFAGKVCIYLEEKTKEGWRWSCKIRKETGSWEEVRKDPRYLRDVIPLLNELDSVKHCEEWPPKGIKCNDCGEVG